MWKVFTENSISFGQCVGGISSHKTLYGPAWQQERQGLAFTEQLKISPFFRDRGWPGLCQLLLAAPCTCWRWLPCHHWRWQQPFPPNAISSLTNFLPLPGPGTSPVTTWCPLLSPCSSMSPLCGGWCWNFIETSCSVDFPCWAIIKWIKLMISLNSFLYCVKQWSSIYLIFNLITFLCICRKIPRTIMLPNNIKLMSKEIAPIFSTDDVAKIKKFCKTQTKVRYKLH